MSGRTKKPLLEASPLTKKIAAHIRQSGPVTLAEYMCFALGDPEFGYYKTKNPFGKEGDFITAPEVSQMFGEMIGAWLVDLWLQMGRPESVKLIELGPGRGTLAADILRTVSAWPDFKAALSLHLVDTSPLLRQMQFETLKAYHPVWYDKLSEVPGGVSFIIANEFFDALPVHQLEKSDGAWKERRIDYNNDQFHFTLTPIGIDLQAIMPKAFLDVPDGSVFEVSPMSFTLLQSMTQRISKYGGAGLLIDYGHVAPGLGDTLQAVKRHKYSNVLEAPGDKDITTHVDFGTFGTIAEADVQVFGPVTQGDFLNALGIAQRAEMLSKKATEKQQSDIRTALHRLTSAEEMGTLFKVMAFAQKGKDIRPAGFNLGERDDEASDNGA